MSDDLKWAETLGKSANQVNRVIERLRAREAVWKDALQDCFDAAHELKPDYLVDFVKRRFNDALATLDVEEKM